MVLLFAVDWAAEFVANDAALLDSICISTLDPHDPQAFGDRQCDGCNPSCSQWITESLDVWGKLWHLAAVWTLLLRVFRLRVWRLVLPATRPGRTVVGICVFGIGIQV